ncbi:hypothetical protein VA596_12210 [Amycolatopsis sp., V23-08]|uniref:ATP-binding protein n=1 Tax=Amycolatopsis heterodermiae TaxID=3110235 RepID=A0ABU5R267_9PSEU|nr:hypothetical protein [Amycolatopsis sp., V23-08]MEA5360301.1 hypothetical protein [Amycolatopsis sp., V23-08]
MSQTPPPIATLSVSAGALPPGVSVCFEARRLAAEVFTDLSAAHLTDVLIVVDELVADAGRHGSRLREVCLCRFDLPMVAHVEVISTPPATPRWTGGADAALGRLLVEELATAWGVQREGSDWMTWAEV